ncbi:TBC1 domain family member 5 [Lepeophtheirus salmonis]|uniref:TBC1 domain family member 5 n=1 Tax=Lepeophtheirus salmonis TaxID=72036 RepID=UPI001AE6ABA1|nr:TBC1 domain family member 5 homolog B-like [Lepeophtheirus salmonis]
MDPDLVILESEENCHSSSHMASSKNPSFEQEFKETFNSIQQLVERVLRGTYRESRFRSLIWSVLLGILDEENKGFEGDWEGALARSRDRYDSLLKIHRYDVRRRADMSTTELEKDNPLSTHSSSSWNQYFINSELRDEILRDVVRTYPGNPLFRSQTMQNTLTDILFIYAKEFPSISYKQGMHEILAAVLLVVREGVDNYVRMKSDINNEEGITEKELNYLFKCIFDPLYTEHDAYALFESIMKRMHDWYWSPPFSSHFPSKKKSNPISSPNRLFDDEHSQQVCENQESREILNASKRLQHMWNDILALNDGELYGHLEELGIIPSTFGLNWLKLMYSRQFFDDYAFLEIWDAIFATNFILQDFILVAMVHAIRTQLLVSDNTGCNTLLVSSYPKFVDVRYIVQYSLYLFDGIRFTRPKQNPLKQSLVSRTSFSIKNDASTSKTRGSFSKLRLTKKKSSQNKDESASAYEVRNESSTVNKSVELVEYLSQDEIKQSLDILRTRISSWKKNIDFNVDFLKSIFKDEDIQEIEKFDRVLSNFKEISIEMRGVLRSSTGRKGSNMASHMGRSSYTTKKRQSLMAEEALDLIGHNH